MGCDKGDAFGVLVGVGEGNTGEGDTGEGSKGARTLIFTDWVTVPMSCD